MLDLRDALRSATFWTAVGSIATLLGVVIALVNGYKRKKQSSRRALATQATEEKGKATKLFLSYAWKDDQPFVERLYRDLAAHRYRPWMDTKNMPSRGRTLPQEVVNEINDCDRLIAIIGPAALTSLACQAEREYALSVGKVVTTILRLGDYKSLPQQLSEYFVPDFRQSRPYEVALSELERVLVDQPVRPARLYDVPAVPPHLLHRSEIVDALRNMVTARDLKPTANYTQSCHPSGHGWRRQVGARGARGKRLYRAAHLPRWNRLG